MVDTPDNLTVHAFGDCAIDVARREVTLRGEPQAVAPRVFELLVFLLARRQRVVTKAELLDGVWGGAAVSENALTRAIVKAREAIGDSARPARLIRTVHRIGYRFTTDDLPPARARDATGRAWTRLAVLPIANATGDDALAWVETGLATMLVQALAADTRLALTGPAAVREALAALGDDFVGVDVPALLQLTGATVLLQARLRRVGERLRLDWRLFGQAPRRGSLQGDEPTELGRRLGEAVESALFPGQRLPVPFVSVDARANQAFARAVHEGEREQWHAAAQLLREVLSVEPASAAARLQYLRALANLHDPEAEAVGAALIETAQAGNDGRLLAAAHEALGRALFNAAGADAQQRSQAHLDAALRLAEPYPDEEWVVRIHLGQAIGAHVVRDAERARHHYGHARRLNAGHGSVLREVTILNNLADLEAADGQPLVARDLAEQALAIGRRHGLVANIVTALCVLVGVEAGFGLLGRAAMLRDEMLAQAAELPALEAELAAWGRVIALDFDTLVDGAAPARPVPVPAELPDAQPRIAALETMACGHRARAAGRCEEACALMEDAATRIGALGYSRAEEDFLAAALATAEHGGPAAEPMLRALHARLAARYRDAACWSLRGALGHAEAALLYAAGDAAGALARLEAQARELPPSRAFGFACLDAAWLHLEAGRIAPARRWLHAAGPWAREHPAGVRAAAAASAAGACPSVPDRLLTSHRNARPGGIAA